jgi:hypothetical protein
VKHSRLKIWALPFLLLLAAWLDYFFPLTSKLVHRAEPISLSAILISVALTAGSYLVQRIFGPKPKPMQKGKLSGDLLIQNSEDKQFITEIFGGYPGGGTITWSYFVNTEADENGNLEVIGGVDGVNDKSAASIETFSRDLGVSLVLTTTFNNKSFGIGWNRGPSVAGVTDVDLNLEFNSSGEFRCTEAPEGQIPIAGSFTPYNTGDRFKITAASDKYRVYKNDVLVYISTYQPLSGGLNINFEGGSNAMTVPPVFIDTPVTPAGFRLAGNVVWAKPPRKVTTKTQTGGKGAPKQTVEEISYFTDLMIMFAQTGPYRLRRLEANGDVIIDFDQAIGIPTGFGNTTSPGGGYDPNEPPDPGSPSGGFSDLIQRATQQSQYSGVIGAGGGATVAVYSGDFFHTADPDYEADAETRLGLGNHSVPAMRGRFCIKLKDFNISKYGSVPSFFATIDHAELRTLQRIANHLCDRVGIEPGDVDFGNLGAIQILGAGMNQRYSPRSLLEALAIPHGIEFYESVDGQLKAFFLGGATTLTIDPNHLGAVEGEISEDNQVAQLIDFRLLDGVQAKREITVSGYEPTKNHEVSGQTAYLATGDSEGGETVELPMTLGANEIRRAAERLLYEEQVARQTATISLPPRYSYFDPLTISQVTMNGVVHRLRWIETAGVLPGPIEVKAKRDIGEVYTQTISGVASGGYVPPPVAGVASDTVLALLDVVNLRDEDNEPILYVGAGPLGDGEWSGAGVYVDRGAGYELITTLLVQATMGRSVNALPDADAAVWDEVNFLDVDLYDSSESLQSLTEAEVLNGGNAAALGTEIIQWQNAAQPDPIGQPRRWRLTRLLRGRRGSEYATSTHVVNERFVVLDSAVVPITLSLSERGVSRNYKGVTSGQQVTAAPFTAFTWDAQNLKPLSVVFVEGSRDGSDNLTISWVRRSRIGQETPYEIGADPPLGEDFERYEIDVLDGMSVVRTITVDNATTTVYLAADQTTDGFTPGDPINVRIYQISARVGRGQVREVIV